MADEVISQHEFERAEDFLAALQPGDARWMGHPGEWVFRGHSDSRWLLLPSQNRRATLAAYFGTKYRGEGLYCAPHPADLGSLMEEFVYGLDRAGYAVPGVGRFTIDDVANKVRAGTPDSHTHEVVALAQHYGLPTYMLDWTRHSKIAAYFAASDSANLPWDLTGQIEVWALNRTVGIRERYSAKIGNHPVHLHMSAPPRAGNPNLHAQGGLFTFNSFWGVEGGALHPADEIVRAMEKTNGFASPAMYRFRLPQRQAGAVLRLLAFEPVTGGTLFPGVSGVVRDVRDRVLLGRGD